MIRRIAVTTIAVVLAGCTPKHRENDVDVSPPQCGSAALRETVTRFGRQLRQVSLLAPDSIRIGEMRRAYAPYVTDSLLQSWAASPETVPGRETSNPWPVGIEVVSSDSVAGGCRVQGNVIYTTSSDTSAEQARFPVPAIMTLEFRDGDWRINAYQGSTGPDGGRASPDAVAAGQVLEQYYAAINAGEYRRAYELWGDSGRSSHQSFEDFRSGYVHTAHVALEVGPAGRIEGAAGSRYVKIPVAIVATSDSGLTQRYEGSYTLRRAVVDGASEAQRRWHIDTASLHVVPPVGGSITQ